MAASPDKLADGLLTGDRRSIAQALSLVESRGEGFRDLLRVASSRTGHASRVGVTGAPGVGKSTLISALTFAAREQGLKVAVLAVDPTSPYTGGALLGDRVRMGEHSGDDGVFVRSMASRGAQGGLGAAAGDVLDVLDAAGFDLLLVETVGAGQVDVDVAEEAETTLVLFAPGAGDTVQAMKSGLMEVADFWVVNKSDDPQAEGVRADIISALSLHDPPDDLDSRVVLVSALSKAGVPELLAGVVARSERLEDSGDREKARRRRLHRRIVSAGGELLAQRCSAADGLVDEVVSGRLTVHDAAEALLGKPAGDGERAS